MTIGRHWIWVVAFLIIAIINLYAVYNNEEWLNYISKPLLMTNLAIYYWKQIPQKSAFDYWVLFALIGSLGGDVCLLFQTQRPFFFLLGLSSFLIAHFCYIKAFTHIESLKNGLLSQSSWLFIPFLGTLVSMLLFLWPDLDSSMQLPVTLYSSVIIMMNITALNLKSRIPFSTFIWIFGGAILFVISDSIIAINKFKASDIFIKNSGFWIMLTYITAQYCIVRGCLAVKSLHLT